MLGHRIFPRPLFSASHGSVAKWGKQTNTQNCKQGTEATFMVFGVLKVSWCFQFLVAGRNQQKNICFTNLYIYIYIDDIFGPIIIQLMLRRTGAWLRRTGA